MRKSSIDGQLQEKRKMLSSRHVWSDEVREFWKRDDVVLDVTVVIPTNSSIFLTEHAYGQAKEVLLLCNGQSQIVTPHAKILRVPWLGHAKTRKVARKYLNTKYTFFSVQDAFPIGNMLSSLVEEMESGQWDIVIPRQIPWPDCHDIDQDRIQAWTPPKDHVYTMPHADHVGSLYRTEDLLQWSLPDVEIAEDVWWSLGRRVGCVPWAKLAHSHPFSGKECFFRERAMHAQLHRLGLIHPPKLSSLLNPFFARRGTRKRVLAESWGQFIGWMER